MLQHALPGGLHVPCTDGHQDPPVIGGPHFAQSGHVLLKHAEVGVLEDLEHTDDDLIAGSLGHQIVKGQVLAGNVVVAMSFLHGPNGLLHIPRHLFRGPNGSQSGALPFHYLAEFEHAQPVGVGGNNQGTDVTEGVLTGRHADIAALALVALHHAQRHQLADGGADGHPADLQLLAQLLL